MGFGFSDKENSRGPSITPARRLATPVSFGGQHPLPRAGLKRLAEFDLSPQQIARVRGPVGLTIGSRTPPEIALSILGDLIASRNGIILEKAGRDTERRRA